MKILAIEMELKPVDWSLQAEILENESRSVYELMLKGYIREIYFTAYKNAVIILECENVNTASELLGDLPLVKKGLTGFDIMELKPYTGFGRIMLENKRNHP